MTGLTCQTNYASCCVKFVELQYLVTKAMTKRDGENGQRMCKVKIKNKSESIMKDISNI